jgi:TIR domain
LASAYDSKLLNLTLVNEAGTEAEIFDVFLCHNSKDKPEVREIARQLAAQGINPWFDEEQIRPGQEIETIKSALACSSARVGLVLGRTRRCRHCLANS